jgi:hypothetical protein
LHWLCAAGVPVLAAVLTVSCSAPAPSQRASGTSAELTAQSASPLSLDELAALQRVMLIGPDDIAALRRSRAVLASQVDAILDTWYGFVGSQPELLDTFVDRRTGKPDGAYLAAVRARFGQWILDTAAARFDQAWLDNQHELALRHHRTKKNLTDGAQASALVPQRYLSALVIPVTTTLKPFLAAAGHTPAEVDAMHAAWVKTVLLQTILWSEPYVRPGEY